MKRLLKTQHRQHISLWMITSLSLLLGCGSLRPEVIERGEKIGMKWVKIPAGSLMMGANDGSSDEKPVHKVKLKSFFISQTEVTVGQYRACVKEGVCSQAHWDDRTCYIWSGSKWMKGNVPQSFRGARHPIVCVDWNQARRFAKWVGGDLCSESQWEYSARAGERFKYSGSDDPEEVAWYGENSEEKTHPVGQKKKNAWGLYDMSGNVWEWTLDIYKGNYSRASKNGKPVCKTSLCTEPSMRRVFRGGSWYFGIDYLHVSNRDDSSDGRDYNLGLRVCRPLP